VLLSDAVYPLLSAVNGVFKSTFNSTMSSSNNSSYPHSPQNSASQNPSNTQLKKEITDKQPVKLAPSMWLRAMTDFDAPFGKDGLPTVWG